MQGNEIIGTDNEKLSTAFTCCDVPDIVRLLCDPHNFVDVNYRDRSQGLLTFSMRLCHCEIDAEDAKHILELLVENGCDLNVTDAVGKTVLCHACIAQRVELIPMICQNKSCDPAIVDNRGDTAIFYAVRSGNERLLKTLLQEYSAEEINLNHVNHKGKAKRFS